MTYQGGARGKKEPDGAGRMMVLGGAEGVRRQVGADWLPAQVELWA